MLTWVFNLKTAIAEISTLTKAISALGAGSVLTILISAGYSERGDAVIDKKLDAYIADHAKLGDEVKKNLEAGVGRAEANTQRIMNGMEVMNQNFISLQNSLRTGEYKTLKPLKFKKPDVGPQNEESL